MKIGRQSYKISITIGALCITPRDQNNLFGSEPVRQWRHYGLQNFKYFYVLFTYIGKVNVQAAMNIFRLTGSGNGGDETFVVLTITELKFQIHSTAACSQTHFVTPGWIQKWTKWHLKTHKLRKKDYIRYIYDTIIESYVYAFHETSYPECFTQEKRL